MKRLPVILAASALVAACGNDGVPHVEDVHNVVVDGQKMTQAAFLQKYCVGKAGNETCEKVANAMRKDSTKGAVPRGW